MELFRPEAAATDLDGPNPNKIKRFSADFPRDAYSSKKKFQ